MAHAFGGGMMGNNELSKAENCEQKLELHIKVEQLRNMDWVGRSDPFCVVYINSTSTGVPPRIRKNPQTQSGLRAAYGRAIQNAVIPAGNRRFPPRTSPWEHVQTTEVIRNSLSASFSTPIRLNYFFERSQMIAIDVYDADGPSQNLLHHDYLGSAKISVPKIVRADGMCKKQELVMEGRPGAFCGYVTVIAENKAQRRLLAKMDIGVNIFQRPAKFSRYVGPYLKILRQAFAGHWIVVYRSKSTGQRDRSRGRYAYLFDSICESFNSLALGRDDTALRFEVVFSVRARDRVVATAEISFRDWQNADGRAALIRRINHSTGDASLTPGSDSRQKGEITLRNFSVSQEPQFIDYVMGGCEMSLVIGIDFTASNGDSMQPSSLHFCDQYRPNEYELAIRTVGDILAKYDSDNRFPAYGFGARLPPDFDSAQHCFSLTGHTDPTCFEIDGVLDAYRQSLYNVRLSGPTEFGLLVQTAAGHAYTEMQRYSQAYTILLIVTDGVINDFEETTRAIVEASHLPLSIVIIGVGDADFAAMDALDGDDVPLSRTRCRDIVQFVPFREYQGMPDMLVSKVLEEIPKQLVEYMTLNNIAPNAPRAPVSSMPGGDMDNPPGNMRADEEADRPHTEENHELNHELNQLPQGSEHPEQPHVAQNERYWEHSPPPPPMQHEQLPQHGQYMQSFQHAEREPYPGSPAIGGGHERQQARRQLSHHENGSAQGRLPPPHNAPNGRSIRTMSEHRDNHLYLERSGQSVEPVIPGAGNVRRGAESPGNFARRGFGRPDGGFTPGSGYGWGSRAKSGGHVPRDSRSNAHGGNDTATGC